MTDKEKKISLIPSRKGQKKLQNVGFDCIEVIVNNLLITYLY